MGEVMLRPKSVVCQSRVTAVVAPLALILGMSVSHQAFAACSPAGAPGTNTYTAGIDVVTCDAANSPVANSLFDLAGESDTLTVNDNPIFSNGGFLRADGVYYTTAVGPPNTQITALTGNTGNDTFNINGGIFQGAVLGDAGNDTFKINGGEFHGTLNGGAGNDLIVINDLTSFSDLTLGTGAGSVGDTADRVFMFDGTITGGEVQIGSGQNNYFFFMGGT